ncbi:MAG: YbaB/EbfC family nucleoid-associated protein [Chlamydiota bacterium]
MGTGYAKKKKQAKQLQKQFEEMQEQMKSVEVSGQAGNGLVTVKLNGEHHLTGIEIKPECVDPDDIEGLEDLIKAAFDDAAKQVSNQMPDMGGAGASMGLPF